MSIQHARNMAPIRKTPQMDRVNSPHGRGPRILVVEDDELVRIMLRLGLERHGFRVSMAADGAEALEVYRENAEVIDVVLLDVCMPGLDGPRTLDTLRRMNPAVTACFMSGDTGIYEPEDLLRRGARHIFVKPFLLDDVAKKLYALVSTSTPCPA